ELVAFIRERYDFCLAGACYPETHPEAPSPEADLQHLKEKVDAGADFLITQLFFDNEDYFAFVERARNAGIHCPIIAGIMPITNVGQVKRFTQLCGTRIPAPLLARLEAAAGDPQAVRAIGSQHPSQPGRGPLERGVPRIRCSAPPPPTGSREITDILRASPIARPTPSP